jgi:hypothetical protein
MVRGQRRRGPTQATDQPSGTTCGSWNGGRGGRSLIPQGNDISRQHALLGLERQPLRADRGVVGSGKIRGHRGGRQHPMRVRHFLLSKSAMRHAIRAASRRRPFSLAALPCHCQPRFPPGQLGQRKGRVAPQPPSAGDVRPTTTWVNFATGRTRALGSTIGSRKVKANATRRHLARGVKRGRCSSRRLLSAAHISGPRTRVALRRT